MCGMTEAEQVASGGNGVMMEGWLRKKSHHLGIWKQRYFMFDGRVMRYWKSYQHARERRQHRGEIVLSACHVVSSGECRLVIQSPHLRFDEELMAKSSTDRDDWVWRLNNSALRHRISALRCQVGARHFLECQDLWAPLETAAMPNGDSGRDSSCSSRRANVTFDAAAETQSAEAVLEHVRFGSAMLSIAECASQPRQGRLVKVGRRLARHVRQWQALEQPVSTIESFEERWVLLVSARELSERAQPAWRRSTPHFPAPPAFPLEFEALHLYSDPLEGGPCAVLPLLQCSVGPHERCTDGSGWALHVESAPRPRTGSAASCASGAASIASAYSGGSESGDGVFSQTVWTMVLESEEECLAWAHAIHVSIWAAKARALGRRCVSEEMLQGFEADQEAWQTNVVKRLADAQAQACQKLQVPSLASTACAQREPTTLGTCASEELCVLSANSALRPITSLQAVLAVCEDVLAEANEILDAALQIRPLRRDICETVFEIAVSPTLALIEQCWQQGWSVALPHRDCRALACWLAGQRRRLHELGVLYVRLDQAVARLAAQLSLRLGEHLRRIVLELLLQAFAPAPAAGPVQPQGQIRDAVSALPVDLFTMIFSCMQFDQDQEVLELRLCSQRVARFLVYEFQEAIWGWLVATQREVFREAAVGAPAGTRGDAEAIPRRTQRWLTCVACLANEVPGFVSHCHTLDALPLCGQSTAYVQNLATQQEEEGVASDSGERVTSRVWCPPDLGPEALPTEWNLGVEVARFRALGDALLWAAADSATMKLRRQMLSAGKSSVQRGSGPGNSGGNGSSLGLVLRAHLDAPLQFLCGLLAPPLYEGLLRRTFQICLATYLVRLSRAGLSASGGGGGGGAIGAGRGGVGQTAHISQLTEDSESLCQYFHSLFNASSGCVATEGQDMQSGCSTFSASDSMAGNASKPPLWEPPWVLGLMRMVMSQMGNSQRWRASQGSGGTAASRAAAPQPHTPPEGDASRQAREGLSRLVANISEGPLPIDQVPVWFGAVGFCQQFGEPPQDVPLGGTFLAKDGFSALRCKRSMQPAPRSPVQGRDSAIEAEGPRACEVQSPTSARRSSACKVGLRARHRSTSPIANPVRSSSPGSAPATPSSRSMTRGPLTLEELQDSKCCGSVVSIASEGGVCELFVEDSGAYGCFACIALSPPIRGSTISNTQSLSPTQVAPPQRRWVQLVREGFRCQPHFQILPMSPAGNSPGSSATSVLEHLSLSDLREVVPRGTTELGLSFQAMNSGARRYWLTFDCPSHVFRWRRVLEAWWAPAPIPGERPVIAVGGITCRGGCDFDPGIDPDVRSAAATPSAIADCQMAVASSRMSLGTLGARLGGLWGDMRPRLEAASLRA